jgi:ADP-L-glycero-D-manno-heptose 6-epimerase
VWTTRDGGALVSQQPTYLVTGGAGFIGSNLVAALAERGADVVVCDWLRQDTRWRNLAKHEIAGLVSPEQLPAWLQSEGGRLDAVLHLGAVSATNESDIDLIASRNVRASFELLQWCTRTATRFIYASSAATYGDGSAGFDDEFSPEALSRLQPLNAYGWSKHVVDRRIARLAERREALPPQWVGLKFFNVYGPNEYHKGSMMSLVAKNYRAVCNGEPLRLFRSNRRDCADGSQQRDFIHVRDCIEVILWLLSNPDICGVFNLGTGRARSWLELAHALFAAIELDPVIDFIDLPTDLADHYQYFTEARIERLRAAGYQRAFLPLELGVRDYVRTYLSAGDPYR